jgi:hypothetical protein
MYSITEVEEYRRHAKEVNLSAPSEYWNAKPEWLVLVCNGCGSDSMPDWAVTALTSPYRYYAPAHNIHDVRFELSDGSASSLELANDEFYINCLRLWRHKYGFLRVVNPFAIWGLRKIRLAYQALRLFGKSAWVTAYKKHLGRQCVYCNTGQGEVQT